jgi:hypothetical protein
MRIEQETVVDLIDALMDMVNQHCQIIEKQYTKQTYVMDYALSSNEIAFEVLENLGLLKRGKPRGCYKLQWNKLNSLRNKEEKIYFAQQAKGEM